MLQGATASMLDDRPIRPWQYAVLALVLMALVIDGVDIQLLALVAPVILKEWGIDRSVFGPALSAALIGMTIGASIGGWLGDRIGRKTVLVAATIFFGACTAAASLTQDLYGIAALRLLSGLGFGAVAPNGAALATEWLPIRARSKVMGLLAVTVPLGGLIGGSTVLALLALYGWRGVFVVCGVATIVLAGALAGWLPESPDYLVRKGRVAKADRVVKRIIGPDAVIPAATGAASERAASIFTRENLRFNTGAWLAYFSLQFIAYGFIGWATVFLTVAGWPLAEAVRATMVFNLSAIAASIVTGFLLGRYSFRPIILIACLGSLARVALIAATLAATEGALFELNRPLTLIATGGVGAFSGAGIAAVYTLLAFVYPVSARASGMGMGLMMGRAGGIAATLVGGTLMALDGDNLVPFFAAAALAALAAIAGTMILGPFLAANRQASPAPMAR
jgi:AAHS family 4-hydroxybenzoate transporter-like MFS transporter